jgi:phasin family protein
MADNEDPKDKTAPELAAKPVVAAPAKPVDAKPVPEAAAKAPEPAAKAADLVASVKAPVPEKAPAPAKAASKPVEVKPIAPKPIVAKPVDKAPVAKAIPVPVPVAKPAVAKPALAKGKPGPKPKITTKPVAVAKPKPAEVVIPTKVAPAQKVESAPKVAAAKSVIEVAKDVKSAVAPVISPKAATPEAAPKTAPTKPVFAGLFTNFMLEETTMDMSTNFAGLQDAMTQAQAKAKAAFEKSSTVLGEVSEFTKGNVEAVVASSKILAEGVQGIGSELVAEGRASFETLTGDIKELAAAKSPTDFFKLQGDIVRKNFDSAVAYSSKNSETMLKLFSDSFAPISGRMSIAMEKARSASL